MTEILLSSSLLILALALLRRLLRGRIDPRLQYGLWLLVALRLLIPGTLFTMPVSIAGAAENLRESVSLALQEQTSPSSDTQTDGSVSLLFRKRTPFLLPFQRKTQSLPQILRQTAAPQPVCKVALIPPPRKPPALFLLRQKAAPLPCSVSPPSFLLSTISMIAIQKPLSIPWEPLRSS